MSSIFPANTPAHGAPVALRKLHGPRGIPILGNALQIPMDRLHQVLEDWVPLYGERYKVAFGPRQIFVCANPDDVAAVLCDRPSRFGRSSRMEMVAKELQMAGVFAANGDNWRRQRALVMQAFNPAHVKSYFPNLQKVASRFLTRLTKQADAGLLFELEPDLMRYTVDVTTGLAFGTDINTIESKGEVIQYYLNDIFRMLQKRLFAPVPYWHWFKRAEDRLLDHNVQKVGETVAAVIQAARERIALNPALSDHPQNLLEAMIAARDDENGALSQDNLVGNVITMLLAGEDTTAHTLAWTLWFLHQHPDAFSGVREEVDRIVGPEAIASSHEQLDRMEFTEACLNESMRLRPVAPVIAVEASIDTEVGGVSLPKGALILLLTRLSATDNRHFLQAANFSPDRWLQPASPQNNRKMCLPFGAGPRLCPGRFLAIEEMKMSIALIAKNFDIEALAPANGSPVEERMSFTMAPVGLKIKLRRRASMHE